MYPNAGKTSTNQQGMFGSMKVWYDPAGIANVVSLKMVKGMFRVTMIVMTRVVYLQCTQIREQWN